jgi:hypothetical protein
MFEVYSVYSTVFPFMELRNSLHDFVVLEVDESSLHIIFLS